MSDWCDSVRELDSVYRVFGRERLGLNHPSVNQWKTYKSKAGAAGTEFSLNRVEFVDLVTDYCFYCTAAPKPTHGVDRVDNRKGYVRGNVVTCCRQCNVAKNDHSREDFESWAIRLGSNLFRWNVAHDNQ
jgi:hypothetical protein